MPVREKNFTIKPEGGLANRVHSILRFLVYSEEVGMDLKVVWGDENITQPHVAGGHFLEVFSPLLGVEFLDSAPKAHVDFQAVLESENFHELPRDYRPIIESRKKTLGEKYQLLKPSADIKECITKLGEKYLLYNACHIRRTDFSGFIENNGGSIERDENFVKFIFNNKLPTYIATDNVDTQNNMVKSCKKLIYFHKKVPDIQPKAVRATSLFDTGVDLFMCCYAHLFKGTPNSTFTGLINRMRAVK